MLEALISKQFKYPPLLEGDMEEQALAHEHQLQQSDRELSAGLDLDQALLRVNMQVS
jgi:hypothetical protein